MRDRRGDRDRETERHSEICLYIYSEIVQKSPHLSKPFEIFSVQRSSPALTPGKGEEPQFLVSTLFLQSFTLAVKGSIPVSPVPFSYTKDNMRKRDDLRQPLGLSKASLQLLLVSLKPTSLQFF